MQWFLKESNHVPESEMNTMIDTLLWRFLKARSPHKVDMRTVIQCTWQRIEGEANSSFIFLEREQDDPRTWLRVWSPPHLSATSIMWSSPASIWWAEIQAKKGDLIRKRGKEKDHDLVLGEWEERKRGLSGEKNKSWRRLGGVRKSHFTYFHTGSVT